MALSANTPISEFAAQSFEDYGVVAAAHIYQGAFVGLNPAGYAKAFQPGDLFAGIAYAEADNSSGLVAAINARVQVADLDFEYTLTSAALTDVGKPVFATADNALALTGHPDAFVGRISSYVTTNTVRVRMREPGETLRDGEVDGVFDLTWSGMRDFATLVKAGTDTRFVPGWAMHAVAAAGAPSIARDKTVGEHVALLAATDEAEGLALESPYVFNITKGFTFEFIGRNSVAGNATDELTFGMVALSTTGLTATERADMVAATAGYKRALFHIVTNALDILAGSDDNTTVVAPTDTTINQALATNTKYKIIGRVGGAIELWIDGARVLSTTTFGVSATGIFGAVVNLEKSAGTGVPAARIKNLRVAGALA